ncbi:plant/T31B5-30 protein [Cinnamomum micranthum f. kanehirae]|uniref:Plant/T31B5-30 protein n=1 Tax=Cinnamomum micranthum f. kanehirae TaxID=337451 RepID=A0A3S3NG34_9MAGN|nr:plant/T31B5-30 protein [Cinnamomum micranthum f. kanehirae]
MPPPIDPLPSPKTSENPLPFPAGKPSSPFRYDGMNAAYNKIMRDEGLTENLSPTSFQSSGNPCMDFFFYALPYTSLETVMELLRRAWADDPLTTLKLICQLRRVGDAGKSDKEGFYLAVLWLHQNHPKTLALNVEWFAQFGYMKDLPEILFRLLTVADGREDNWQDRRYRRRKALNRERVRTGSREEEMERARELRKNRRAEMAKKVVERYYSDSNYRFLHDKISDFFAESLKSDIGFLNSGEFKKIGLAAKWCPSLYSSFDRSTLLCETIAKRVFPRESDPSYSEIEEAHYSYRVRDRLRKEILVPLRKSLKLPELYMSSNRWRELPYERVPSLAMNTYKKLFEKHDSDRFREFVDAVSRRRDILTSRSLLPHEIISFQCKDTYHYPYTYYDPNTYHRDPDIEKVREWQWNRMVEDFSKKGKLRNMLSVCYLCQDDEKRKRVSIALRLLISELSEEPWRGNVISFTKDPQLHRIQGETLQEKVKFIDGMEFNGEIDFPKVFDRILDVAVASKLEEEKMVKRMFVFCDLDFYKPLANSWDAIYASIKRKYKEMGYGSSVPDIVFWNLTDSRLPQFSYASLMPRREKGVALLRGFSKDLLNIFLDNDGVVNPEELMEAAIAGEEYQKLRVFD